MDVIAAEPIVTRPPRRGAAITVVTLCTLLCVVDLLARQLAASAPLRGASDPAWPTRIAALQFDDVDKLVRQAADGHNLQLELDSKSMSNPTTQGMLTLLYFRSVYALFPQRVFVGYDNNVINNGPQLAGACEIPSGASVPSIEGGDLPASTWMRSHDVKNILHLGVVDDGSLVVSTRSIR